MWKIMYRHEARTPDVPPRSATLPIAGPLRRADLRGLHARTRALLGGGGVEVLRCELTGVQADAVTLHALARLALLARRQGARMRLQGASRELLELIDLAGLRDVLGGEPRR
jgi:ABC-type transporter Mla MlaB component